MVLHIPIWFHNLAMHKDTNYLKQKAWYLTHTSHKIQSCRHTFINSFINPFINNYFRPCFFLNDCPSPEKASNDALASDSYNKNMSIFMTSTCCNKVKYITGYSIQHCNVLHNTLITHCTHKTQHTLYRYNKVNFLQNSQKGHSIARPLGEIWSAFCVLKPWFILRLSQCSDVYNIMLH